MGAFGEIAEVPIFFIRRALYRTNTVVVALTDPPGPMHSALNTVVVASVGVEVEPSGLPCPIFVPSGRKTSHCDVPTLDHERRDMPPLLTVEGFAMSVTMSAGVDVAVEVAVG